MCACFKLQLIVALAVITEHAYVTEPQGIWQCKQNQFCNCHIPNHIPIYIYNTLAAVSITSCSTKIKEVHELHIKYLSCLTL